MIVGEIWLPSEALWPILLPFSKKKKKLAKVLTDPLRFNLEEFHMWFVHILGIVMDT